VDEDLLRDLFKVKGTVVSTRVIRDYNGRSKGFGYVQFENDSQLQAALVLNGEEFEGRVMKVDVSVKSETRPQRTETRSYRGQRSEYG